MNSNASSVGASNSPWNGSTGPGVYEPAFTYGYCPEGNTDPTRLVSYATWSWQQMEQNEWLSGHDYVATFFFNDSEKSQHPTKSISLFCSPGFLGQLPEKTGGCESKILKSPKSEMDLLLECGCLHQASKDLTCVPSCIEPDPIPSDITKDPEGNWVPCLENMRVVTLGVLYNSGGTKPWDFGMFTWLDGNSSCWLKSSLLKGRDCFWVFRRFDHAFWIHSVA